MSGGNKDILDLDQFSIRSTTDWHPQEELILKQWGDYANSYYWMYDRTHRKYRKRDIAFTLPVIILSTVTGTLNFAQGSLKGNTTSSNNNLQNGNTGSLSNLVPFILGGLNIIAGIITTTSQFLNISSLRESHKVASRAFDKLSRDIELELKLPLRSRSLSGIEFIKRVKIEMERLLDQSPLIPIDIVKQYEKNFKDTKICQPELLKIRPINIYHDEIEKKEQKTADVIARAVNILNEPTISNNAVRSTFQRVVTNLKHTKNQDECNYNSNDNDHQSPKNIKETNDISQNISQSISQDSSQNISQDSSQGNTQNISQDSSQGISQGISQDIAIDISPESEYKSEPEFKI